MVCVFCVTKMCFFNSANMNKLINHFHPNSCNFKQHIRTVTTKNLDFNHFFKHFPPLVLEAQWSVAASHIFSSSC